MAKANRFIENGAFQDDLTVLVAKLVRKPVEGAHPIDLYCAGAGSQSGRSTVMGA